MNKKQEILNELLSKWERSAAFKTKKTSRRIIIHPEEKFYSNLREKKEFISAVNELCEDGVLSYEWEKGEEGNIVNSIWLNLSKENIDKAYILAERQQLSNFLKRLNDIIKNVAANTRNETLRDFLVLQVNMMEETARVPGRFFSCDDNQFNENILRAVLEITDNNEECSIRVFSTRLFHDSKYFERIIRSSVMKILKECFSFEEMSDDEILASFGIVRYPEIIEFKGNIRIFLKNGEVVDYSEITDGAYINSVTVDRIERVEVSASSFMSIENKANYYAYIRKSDKNEIVVFHGGFHSPAKKHFLTFISKALSPDADIWHWSDIDKGGFDIFISVKQIFPYAKPYLMDLVTLEKNSDKAMPLEDQKYINSLRDAVNDEKYSYFKDVIEYMIDHKIRLEQESLLIDE